MAISGDSMEPISRALLLGAESETRHFVVNALRKFCAQSEASEASQGVHNILLKTKYYSAEVELHVHDVQHNELQTELQHEPDAYEALLWVVDASSDDSVRQSRLFVENSIEELDFAVSLVIGLHADAATNSQLSALEQWGQANGFEFVPVKSKKAGVQDANEYGEKHGMDRVLEAMQCNMWASMKKAETGIESTRVAPAASVDEVPVMHAQVQQTEEEESTPPSKILVLGVDTDAQRDIVGKIVALCNTEHRPFVDGEMVQPLMLKTKYYEAEVELHVHHIEVNELVSALQHEVEDYEALVWVVDAAAERTFLEAKQFVEKSMEELSFDVSLLVGARADEASVAHDECLHNWSQENSFEYIRVPSHNGANILEAEDEKHGVDRILEALHCNMWRSMKMLPRDAHPPATATASDSSPPQLEDSPRVPTESSPSASPAETSPQSHDERLQASLAAISGVAGPLDGDDMDMEAFGNLLSQVRHIRETGASLSDQERRQQAEQVAMQLWSLLGADESDDGGMDSD